MSEITYTMQGDYQLPNLKLPEQRSVVLGKYASLRRKYLKEHHRVLYYNLLTSCKLEETPSFRSLARKKRCHPSEDGDGGGTGFQPP